MTDSFGRVIDFRNVVLIMTSNIGADLDQESEFSWFPEYRKRLATTEQMRKDVMGEVEKFFRP